MAAVTLTDVARRAGVSQPTASRVLNGSARKPAQRVVDAVRLAADELGYIPNAQAQALARSTTGLLGLVVHDIADPYFSTIVGGVQRSAAAHQRQVMLAATLRSPEAELASLESFAAHRVDAIIMVGSRSTEPAAVEAAARLRPVLARFTANGGRLTVIGQQVPEAGAVVPDNRGGAAALADALVQLGLRRFIVFAGPADLVTAVDRTDGFSSALAAHGLSPISVIHGEFTRDGGFEAARQVVPDIEADAVDPVCVFAVNDVMALGAMTAFREAGLRIPQDVQVAGFDDIPTLRDHSPGLTTMRLPLDEMGRWAVELALGCERAGRKIDVPAEVVLRGSTTALR